jgi:hypothetical protein
MRNLVQLISLFYLLMTLSLSQDWWSNTVQVGAFEVDCPLRDRKKLCVI